MEDQAIVSLYWNRDERAIPVTADKYGAYCHTVAANILRSPEDVEECINDTWLGAWNAIPPHKPAKLSAFLAKITRNLAYNRVHYNTAQKRSGNLQQILTELDSCVDPEETIERAALVETLNTFLRKLPPRKRKLFLRRYWYAQPIADIARETLMTQGAVTMQLKRIRQQLCTYLHEQGVVE